MRRPRGGESERPPPGRVEIHEGDNLPLLAALPDASFDLIYVDPPFNTGRDQERRRLRTERGDDGDRVGFQGRRYRTTVLGSARYADHFDDYLEFLVPRLREAHRLLAPTGSFFLHLDYREVHYVKVALDGIFGRDAFINEIIWAYDYGARSRRRWSAKHDNILWYARDPRRYHFDHDAIDRIPYMAPGLVGPVKAARGKTPTDTWWHTIVSPTGKEKTGYPTQKPLGILERIVRVHSRPGARLLDFFAGSGSFGEAAAALGRDVVLIDANPEAIAVMERRLARFAPQVLRPAPIVEPTAAPVEEPAGGAHEAVSILPPSPTGLGPSPLHTPGNRAKDA
ncbi:MAG TPA: DNA methyltransferase [Nannocystaceae bacterium]|nr:DNA methyltransferase [Nannocystaceae bacterium]